MGLKDYSREEMQKMPMIELAHIILKENKKAAHYSELYDQVAEMKGFTEEQKEEYLPQFYTDLTVDGRLITTGSGIWGLKRWYSVEQIDEEGGAPKKKKKNSAKKKTTKKQKAAKKEEPELEPEPEPDVPENDLEVLTGDFKDEIDDEEDHYDDDFDDERDERNEYDEHDEEDDEEYEDEDEEEGK